MQTKTAIRKEHAKARDALKSLEQKWIKAGSDGPLPDDKNLYFELNTIKNTLEWIEWNLIETTAKGCDSHLGSVTEHRFHMLGPVDSTLTWGRRL